MPFIVPQFIEREAAIFGPFTFKQFIFIGTAGGISIFLYFILPFFLFIIAAFLLVGTALALALFRMGGSPLPVVIKNFFVFSNQPKVYLWKRKNIPPKILKKAAKPKTETEPEEESALKVVERSRLRELASFLESKTK